MLASFGGSLNYHLHERGYLHNLKKVLWHWKATLWPTAPEDAPETEESPDG